MGFYIGKIIVHNRAPFDHLDLSFQEAGVNLLTAYNGGGKTTIISHVVDAFYEMARPFYPNEFENAQNKLYRVSSDSFSLDPQKPSVVYIRFCYVDNDNEERKFDYIDIRNNCTKEEYDEIVKLDGKIQFNSFSSNLAKNSFIKYFSDNLTKDKVNSIFSNNILTFFPTYRYEYPGYLNDTYKEKMKFDLKVSYSGYLPNPIEIITNLDNLTNWMMDVLLDWQVYKTTQNLQTSDGHSVSIDVTQEKTAIWDALNQIVNHSIVNDDGGSLRLGIGKRLNPGQRISIMRVCKGETFAKYPSIFNLSTGETSMISLFGEILHQADSIGADRNVSGIVLIDEIDKNLHIKLQKEILPKLFKIFPNIQFILSSHSPFVSMGLNKDLSKRFSLVYLSNNTGMVIKLPDNPLYDEVYQMLLKDNENYKELYTKLLSSNKKKCQLLVEDKYDQIYKIAWLKLKNIPFSKDTLDSVFEENSPFEIINSLSSSGVAGCLSVNNPDLFAERIIVGLFDYDKEGSEKFYHLREGFSKNDIQGDLSSGFYRKKKTNDYIVKMYALLLPVPDRLKHLISRSQNDDLWSGDGNFSNFVEIESLLDESFVRECTLFSKTNICGYDYYKAKDEKKSVLWEELISLPTNVFADYLNLYKIMYKLFELEEFES